MYKYKDKTTLIWLVNTNQNIKEIKEIKGIR